MLVISHDAQHRVTFSQIGITVSIIQAHGCLVKLHLDDPESASVGIGQNVGDGHTPVTIDDHAFESADARERAHCICRELNLLRVRLESTQRRIDRGELFDPSSTLQWMFSSVKSVDQEMSLRPVASITAAAPPIRLLIVEDSDNERGLVASLLAQRGFDVYVARGSVDVHRPLRLLGCSRPDLVLMDMQLPLPNGIETLHRIREDDSLSDLKVYAITSCARRPEIEPVGRGWDRWFQTPININKLIECLLADIFSCTQTVGR